MTFKEFNLHTAVMKGLEAGRFKDPKQVQSKIIPMAQEGKNIVCSAKTGSGKTLAFLVPVLERLLTVKWARADGLGAVIISPTRELALQTFSVLQVIGQFTHLSGGLLIGGRDVEREKSTVGELNIVVCTPGRLLDHLESGWNFSGDNVECLVIDEADKLMEMGFKQTVESILEYMNKKRQTLLFSATADVIAHAKRVWDISNPEFVSVSGGAEAEPFHLRQEAFVVTPAQKLDLLYVTIKSNIRKRIIVFLTTCKEVTFYYTLIKKMRFGLGALYLNGNMSQNKRIETFYKFAEKDPKILFCTDIAARGLDFPAVDIVLQLDAPDSKETYVHRAGRTARNGAKGTNILAISKHEVGVLEALREVEGFPESPREYTGKRSIEDRVKAMVKNTPEIYVLAQKYVKTYKGYLRVAKKEQVSDREAVLQELIEYLGVQEDENVSWSADMKKKNSLRTYTKLE
ncbi:ATP-dependent RNA helicase DDX10/DBP4 [Nematocida major]|uniref:ATP-dependent RNA helicase DDX10/DBP4 n=1 Tax=Nematocida major TaxID=1912982 RepID=UPI0020080BC6|nr:ATP-dependent RNA helicase DDX10/DBP4 [Nematocida major]KAH9387209.1 ATP-dependent RNA helicase DDX10/DBP4 [Nematocida major]